MEATEQYFPVVLNVYYALQGGSKFRFVDEFLTCDQSIL